MRREKAGNRRGGNRRTAACSSPRLNLSNPRPAGGSNASGAPKTDADLLPLHQDRHLAVTLGELQHLFHGLGILFDIPIDDRQPFFGLGLPGLLGEGSGLLAENGDLLGHGPPPEGVSR